MAHIYPSGINSERNSDLFWTILGLYWSSERCGQWKISISTEKGTEICENIITMAPSVHAYWSAALFALKPLKMAEDKKSMEVQFFWLPKIDRQPLVPLTHRPELPADLQGSVENVKLFNCETEEKICSGDKFTLRTNDPEITPLPSLELLEMQWLLHRLTALCGGIGDDGDADDSDDDDDDDDVTYYDYDYESDEDDGVKFYRRERR